MTIEIEPINEGPRSIYELMILTQIPDVVDDILNTTYDSEIEIIELIENRGYRLGEGSPDTIPPELKESLSDFNLKRHSVIDGEGKVVASIGILIGDESMLNKLNTFIEKWEASKKIDDQQTNS